MRYFKCTLLLLTIIALIGESFAQSTSVFAPSSVLSEGRWWKIALDGKEDGVYQITYAQLEKMGFSKPDNVGIYGFGGHILDESISETHYDDLPEIATYHDNNNKRILFFGQGLISWKYDNDKGFIHEQNPYSNKAYYFVHEKDSEALSMATVESGTEFDMAVDYSNAHLLHEEELINIGRTGRELYGESFTYNQTQNIAFKEKLNPGEVKVSANLIALSANVSSYDIKHGNEIIGSVNIKGTTNSYAYAVEGNFSRTITLENVETPTFRIAFNQSSSAKNAHLNYIRLEGKQNISLGEGRNQLLFRNTKAINSLVKYQTGNISNDNIQIWDITNPCQVYIQSTFEDGSFVAKEKGLKEYALVDINAKQHSGISIVGAVNNQNLHSTKDVDMIIVSPIGLKTYAQRLADFRSTHDGFKVKVVTDEEIFNEYSSGTADATAIRLYMKQVFGRKGNDENKYLLLFGDGFYDNRKIDGNPRYLVSYETASSLVETSSTVYDDYFGFIEDNETMNVAIGRIPVHTEKDAEAVVKKIIEYSSNYHYGSWKNRLCFLSDDDKVSDNSSDAPNTHMKHNDQVIDLLQNTQGHKEFLYQKIYLPAYTQTTTASGTDYPDARKVFQESLQQGVLLVNYAGHGATNSITNEGLMTTAKAAQLNMKNLPLWVTASCDISRWDDDEDSMGETLLLNNNGGAIALISTTRVVYALQNLSLNLAIARNIFNRKSDGSRYRLGDILMAAKRSLGTDFNKLNFCLLGDPSMVLAYPEYEMEITDVDYSDKITIKGRVIDPGTNETATDFNGLIYPTIYDAEEKVSADKGLFQNPVYEFSTRTKKIFTGRDVIHNGLFEFSFITPKDVSKYSADGLVNLYACNEGNDEANGFYDNLIIRQPDLSSTTDTTGPEISKIFINSSEFKNGDAVGSSPYFFAEIHDESGFNATGNSVGHDITITIRCTSNSILAPKQYVLNNYLTTYTGDPTTGNIRFTIPELSDGEYDITFKIWDSMNNSSSETIHIAVNDKQKLNPVLVQAYPSPVSQGDNVTFRVLHNMPESQTSIRLQIFTQTGIKVLETTATADASDIVYLKEEASNITDINTSLNADETSVFLGSSSLNWRASVAPGIYIYKVYITSRGSETASESKLLMVKPE